MSSKPLQLEDIIEPDDLATRLSTKYHSWEMFRNTKKTEWDEIQRYIFATDTNKTKNSSLPWSNKTTIPKLCQIRDNLFANYMAALFPKRQWMTWEGATRDDEGKAKKDAINSYMEWAADRNEFYSEIAKLVLDYIDYGNVFCLPEWMDNSNSLKDGYIGPAPRRVSPLDIVFDPTAANFASAPKIIRSIISIGELKDMIEKGAYETEEESLAAQKLFDRMIKYRNGIKQSNQEMVYKDNIYHVAGFSSYQQYLASDYVEVLTFFGDYYDSNNDTYARNKVVKIVDRCLVLGQWDNPSFFGQAPIYHVGWRVRPDNLWAMGPLDNLVGMQYRLDHLENMKADVFDIIAYPPLKVKGQVQDFEWKPMERIYVGDDGDVTMLAPDTQALQADNQIAILEAKMEEMAGSPKEAMGFRTPGEKTMYEVQRLEAAAGRIFQSKIAQFERDLLEPLLNAMLELARRKMTSAVVRVFDDQNKIAVFQTLTVQDITGSGRIRPVAARHFAEKATQVQNLTNFFASSAGADPSIKQHFSSVELAKMWECLLDLESYNIVEPYIAITEAAEAQKIQASNQQMVAQSVGTPSGILQGEDDSVPPSGTR